MTTPIEGMTPVPEDGLREALRTLIEVNETTCFQLRRWGHEQSADYLADQIAVARAALARSTPVPAANVSEDEPCVGCGQPTRSRTDDGTPRHIDCPAANVSEGLPSERDDKWFNKGYWLGRKDMLAEIESRSTPVPAAEVLDEERLARAMFNVNAEYASNYGATDEQYAVLVAAEYGRLK